MRKQTAPRTRKRRHASSRPQPGLIAQDLSAPQSATPDSVLDNRSHRTRIRHNCLIILPEHPRRINRVFCAQPPDYAELHKQFVWTNRQEAESRRRGRPIALPRLSAPPKSAPPSRRLRRLTTARPGLRLVRGVDRAFYYNPAKYRTYLEQLGITYPTERAADGSCAGGASPQPDIEASSRGYRANTRGAAPLKPRHRSVRSVHGVPKRQRAHM